MLCHGMVSVLQWLLQTWTCDMSACEVDVHAALCIKLGDVRRHKQIKISRTAPLMTPVPLYKDASAEKHLSGLFDL